MEDPTGSNEMEYIQIVGYFNNLFIRNSASAIRAAAGEAKMRGEICDVCEVIFHNGQKTEEGHAAIQFGPLFSVGVNNDNDTLYIACIHMYYCFSDL